MPDDGNAAELYHNVDQQRVIDAVASHRFEQLPPAALPPAVTSTRSTDDSSHAVSSNGEAAGPRHMSVSDAVSLAGFDLFECSDSSGSDEVDGFSVHADAASLRFETDDDEGDVIRSGPISRGGSVAPSGIASQVSATAAQPNHHSVPTGIRKSVTAPSHRRCVSLEPAAADSALADVGSRKAVRFATTVVAIPSPALSAAGSSQGTGSVGSIDECGVAGTIACVAVVA